MPVSPSTVTASVLRSWLDTSGKSLAIVDVRDADYFGGHIRSCINVPSSSFYSKMSDLQSALAGTQKVVFHCQLSQQRGPSCAAAYCRHLTSKGIDSQEVYVLLGGFSEWARNFGDDSGVTEGYLPELYK